MSSYLTHHRPPREGEMGWQVDLDWREFTAKRLAWLYGDQDRSAQAAADLAAWNRLGSGKAAA